MWASVTMIMIYVKYNRSGFVKNGKHRDLPLQSFKDYQKLITEVDQLCYEIRQSYGKYIACKKGCAGNCCQRHINVFPVEAIAFGLALRTFPQELADRIRHMACVATSFGPCPLLEDGACLMYESRAIICRTHGYPILNEYRGQRTVDFCHKNFKNVPSISEDRLIELAPLNKRLAAINQRFTKEFDGWRPMADRFTIGEALMLDIPFH